MNDEKLKLIVAILAGLIFSLIFVLLAFVLPLQDESVNTETQAKKTL
jgi:capsular polysaccharide biosynthesis protein